MMRGGWSKRKQALWWSRGEKEVPLVRQEELEEPEDPEGPPKIEFPKVPQVLEKVEAPKCPLRIEVAVESSKPIDEEKCDTREFRSKSNKAKEEEREVGPIPVEKTSLAGSKEHPMEAKEELVNPEDMKTEEDMRAMEVGEYPEEKETRYSGEEGSRPRWDREESSSDVSSPFSLHDTCGIRGIHGYRGMAGERGVPGGLIGWKRILERLHDRELGDRKR